MGNKTNLKALVTMSIFLLAAVVGTTNVCKGNDANMVVDDMEDYNDRDDIREVWRDGNADVKWGGTYPFLFLVRGGSSGSNLNVSTAVGSPLHGGTGPIYGYQAMVLRYDNDGWTYTGLPSEEKLVYDAPYYSEIEANTIGNNSLDVGQNWASYGVKSLSLSFQGHPISDGFYDASEWRKYTVNGRGRDIQGRHDEFYFFSQYPFIGNGSIQAQVLSVENTHPWAKAGVMIREKWTPYSKYAAVFMTPGNGVTFQYRDVEDGPTTTVTKPGVSAPQYVRLVRNINGAFEAKHSDNPFVWQDVNAPGTAPVFPEIAMGTIDDPNIYVGSAVSSHNANQICSADFNTLEISPLPPNWIFGNIGTNDPEQLYVALSDGTTTAVVNHPNPNAATLTEWQEWNIELTAFNGVDFNSVQKVYIGLGDRDNPVYGGSGTVYIDVYDVYHHSLFLFVDAGAPAGGNGSSWADALINLQDALAVSIYGDEIFVAQGTYKPDANTANPTGTGDRTATFQLINGAAIYGGYAGFGAPDPNARDIKLYPTILSGDLSGDDGPDFANNGENSYHVVTGGGKNVTTVLDGFTITGGNADGAYPYNDGGGMFNKNSKPTIANCTFRENSANNFGAGMYNEWSYPAVTNCMFIGNSAKCYSGMCNYSSDPTVTNCLFIGNWAGPYGNGGGMGNSMSNSVVTNCMFSGNSASYGGAIYNLSSSNPTLINCTFSANSGSVGGNAIGCNSRNNPSTVQLVNCILWDGGDEIWNNDASTITITYSDVQGGWSGPGANNINLNPLFKDADGDDDIVGTEDDNLRLSAGSPCIDAGDNNSVPADAADLDGDDNSTEPTPFDLDGNPRLFDDPITADTGYPPWADAIVDMGAYEFYGRLVAHWKLDEKGGTMAWDSSGNGHHGILYGDPNWQPAGGRIGGALEFDGDGDAVSIPKVADSAEFTYALWVKQNVIGSGLIALIDHKDWVPGSVHFEVRDGHPKVGINDSIEPGGDLDAGAYTLAAGQWNHVVLTKSAVLLAIYVDAELATQRELTVSDPVILGDGYIGAFLHAIIGDRCFNGLIDDVRIYNYALSGDEIRWLLCARPPRGDVNRDCKVNFLDFAILASGWLDCGFMVQELCGQ